MDLDVEGEENTPKTSVEVERPESPEKSKDESDTAVTASSGEADNKSTDGRESAGAPVQSETHALDANSERGEDNSEPSEDSFVQVEPVVNPESGEPVSDLVNGDSESVEASEPDQVDAPTLDVGVDAKSTVVKETSDTLSEPEGRQSPEEEDEEPATLEVIDKKREEEKQMFQQLIEDSARLEKRVEFLENCKTELETKLDVCTIELETYKEQCSYQKEQIEVLEKQSMSKTPPTPLPSIVRPTQEPTLSSGDNDTNNLMNTIKETHEEREQLRKQLEESTNSSQMNQLEVKELKLRIQRMSTDDQIKTDRIQRLEADLSDKSETLERVEAELGVERMNRLKSTNNGASAHASKTNAESNVIKPNEKSGVCIIS